MCCTKYLFCFLFYRKLLFFDIVISILVHFADRFRHHGSPRLSRIRTQSTSRMSLPASRYTWHHRRLPVHLNSISRQLQRATNCRTLSRFLTTAAAPVWAVTLVTCQPRTLLLKQHWMPTVVCNTYTLLLCLTSPSSPDIWHMYSVQIQVWHCRNGTQLYTYDTMWFVWMVSCMTFEHNITSWLHMSVPLPRYYGLIL